MDARHKKTSDGQPINISSLRQNEDGWLHSSEIYLIIFFLYMRINIEKYVKHY